MHRIFENFKVNDVIPPQSKTSGAVTASAFDCKGYRGEALFLLNVGACTQNGTVDAKLQECDTAGGTYADISGASLTQITGGASALNKAYAISQKLDGRKRYLKPVVTVGSGCTALVAGNMIATGAEETPANAAAAGLTQRDQN